MSTIDAAKVSAEIGRINRSGLTASERHDQIERVRRMAECLKKGGAVGGLVLFPNDPPPLSLPFCERVGCGFLVRDHATLAAKVGA